MGTVTFNPNSLQIPIAKMGPWDFWSRIEAVGISDELAQHLLDGQPLTSEQRAILQNASRCAQERLIHAEPGTAYVRSS